MNARIVAVFLLLGLSTGYSLKNDDVDDDILDMLQETDKLKEAPEMVRCDASLTFSSCFAFSAIFHPGHTQIKIICNFDVCDTQNDLLGKVRKRTKIPDPKCSGSLSH